jgi:hypothetical protein
MHRIWWFLVTCLVLLPFCAAVFLGYLAWQKMAPRTRTAGVLLLVPHFLLIASIAVSLACGHPLQGSSCFNTQFFCAVLVVFILPVPALVGTLVALGMFYGARSGS